MSVTPDDRDPTVPDDETPAPAEAPAPVSPVSPVSPASVDAPPPEPLSEPPAEPSAIEEPPAKAEPAAPAKTEPAAPRFLRAFLAVNLAVPAVRRIADEVAGMKGPIHQAGVRVAWVPPANMHVTVKFLGPIRREVAEGIRGALARGLQAHQPFELEARGMGAFPSAAHPRVLWAGLREQPALVALQQAVEGWMEELGFPREGRAFHPHLTIGRVRASESGPAPRFDAVEAALAARADLVFGGGRVTEVVLYESRTLGRGAEYHPLARVPIGAGI